jgi:hypothetical protein
MAIAGLAVGIIALVVALASSIFAWKSANAATKSADAATTSAGAASAADKRARTPTIVAVQVGLVRDDVATYELLNRGPQDLDILAVHRPDLSQVTLPVVAVGESREWGSAAEFSSVAFGSKVRLSVNLGDLRVKAALPAIADCRAGELEWRIVIDLPKPEWPGGVH